jgi:hypothetical protein
MPAPLCASLPTACVGVDVRAAHVLYDELDSSRIDDGIQWDLALGPAMGASTSLDLH